MVQGIYVSLSLVSLFHFSASLFSHHLTFVFNFHFLGCMGYWFFFKLKGRLTNPNEEHEGTVPVEKLTGKKRKF